MIIIGEDVAPLKPSRSLGGILLSLLSVVDRTMASRRIRDPGPSTLAGRRFGSRVSRPLVTGAGTVSACWAR